MKKYIVLGLVFLILGCSQKVDISKIDSLNGYWQISKVLDDNGNKKEYPINEVYDFFEIKNKKGFHKKVVWQPTGKFLVNDMQDDVKLVQLEEEFFLEFSSKFGKHMDQLASISDNEMVLISKEKVKYYYSKVALDKDIYGKTN